MCTEVKKGDKMASLAGTQAAKMASEWCIDESDGDSLQFVGPLLLGQTKWLGAAVMRDGSLVGMPGHARQVLRIDPRMHRVMAAFGLERQH